MRLYMTRALIAGATIVAALVAAGFFDGPH
jgi:hypothetical protein